MGGLYRIRLVRRILRLGASFGEGGKRRGGIVDDGAAFCYNSRTARREEPAMTSPKSRPTDRYATLAENPSAEWVTKDRKSVV